MALAPSDAVCTTVTNDKECTSMGASSYDTPEDTSSDSDIPDNWEEHAVLPRVDDRRAASCSALASTSGTAKPLQLKPAYKRLKDDEFLYKHGLEPNNITVVHRLGEGAHGSVDLVNVHMPSGRICRAARKVLHGTGKQVFAMLQREVDGMRSVVGCPSAVQLLAFENNMASGRHEILMEFVEGTTLHEMLEVVTKDRQRLNCLKMPEASIKHVVSSLLHAVNALNQRGMAHGDVKPQNILVSTDCKRVVLADFGLTGFKQADGSLDVWGGTPVFNAPEMRAAKTGAGSVEEVGIKSDISAVGAVAASCAAFGSSMASVSVFMTGSRSLPVFLPDDLRDFILWLTAAEPRHRPTAAQALLDPYLQGAACYYCSPEGAAEEGGRT